MIQYQPPSVIQPVGNPSSDWVEPTSASFEAWWRPTENPVALP